MRPRPMPLCATARRTFSRAGADIAESPLTERAAVELCHVVIRSLEQIAAQPSAMPSASGGGVASLMPDDVVLPR